MWGEPGSALGLPVTQIDNDSTKISWSRGLKNDLRRNKALSFEEGRIAMSQYRSFTRQLLYLSCRLNDVVCQIPKLFTHGEAEDRVICVTGRERRLFVPDGKGHTQPASDRQQSVLSAVAVYQDGIA